MTVHYERVDDVARLTLDGDDRLNKVDADVLVDLEDALDRASDASCLVLTGAGSDAFSAGGDLDYVSTLSVSEAYEYASHAHRVINKLERHPRPVVAAVNGYALGAGCQLLLGCDVRVASEDARIGQPEIDIGITPGFGATQRLPRFVGRERAMRMVLLGEHLTAAEARDAGLVGEVVSASALDDRAAELAAEIASKPTFAASAAKEAIVRADEMTLSPGLDYEKRLWSSLFGTPDQTEGMTAFLDDREPEFE